MEENTYHTEKKEGVLVLKSVILSVIATLFIVGFALMYLPEEVGNLIAKGRGGLSLQNAPLSTLGEATIPDVVEKVSPAVVSVVITADVPIIERYFEEYQSPFERFFGGGQSFTVPRERQIGTERQEIGGGTGFIVSSDGYIITNRHVVDSEDVDYSIVTSDGTTYDVSVVAKDPMLDIAILKIEGDEPFPYLEFGESESVRPGATVIAIGNALAEFPNTVSVGVISGLSRNIVAGDQTGLFESLEGVIQTDAAINQGNSGGPLLNTEGRVIGVNVAVANGVENIGFALPIDAVKNAFLSVQETGEIARPFVGVRYVQITDELAEENDLSVEYGVLIVAGDESGEVAVVPDSPASRAGLHEDDIILEIDGQRLDGSRSFGNILRDYRVGDAITLKVLQNGSEKDIQITLEKASSE